MTTQLDREPLRYVDRDSAPLTWAEWRQLFADKAYRLVAQYRARAGGVRTYWTGIVADDGTMPPYVTKIADGPNHEGLPLCSATEAEAVAQHERCVAGIAGKSRAYASRRGAESPCATPPR